MGWGFWGMVCGVGCGGCEVWCLGFGMWGVGCRVRCFVVGGLGFGVWGLG
jgi:hypothetical protein